MSTAKPLAESEEPEHQLRRIIDTIPALAWRADWDGSLEFLNQQWLDYSGLSSKEAEGWGWRVTIRPADVKGLEDYWRTKLASGERGESRRASGVLTANTVGSCSAPSHSATSMARSSNGTEQTSISKTAKEPRNGCVRMNENFGGLSMQYRR